MHPFSYGKVAQVARSKIRTQRGQFLMIDVLFPHIYRKWIYVIGLRRANSVFSSLTSLISLCSLYDWERECIIGDIDKSSKGNCPFVFLLWKGPLGPPSYIVKGDAQPYLFLLIIMRSLNNKKKKKRVYQAEQCSSLPGEGRWPMWPFPQQEHNGTLSYWKLACFHNTQCDYYILYHAFYVIFQNNKET